MDSRYVQNTGATFALNYHIVWCPKYRIAVRSFWTPLPTGFAFWAEKSAELGMTIHALEVMPDHVHRFVESDPTRCVAEIVNRLKGSTSRVLRREFPSLRSRLPTLGSRSSFASSLGHVSAATMERYIAEQKGK